MSGAAIFKKKKKKSDSAAAAKKRSLSSDDEADQQQEEEANTTSTAELILKSKKKRKVLASATSKKGLDSSLLFKKEDNDGQTHNNPDGSAIDASAIGNKGLGDRLKSSFAVTGSEGQGTSETVILSQHEKALEDFVNQGMGVNDSKKSDDAEKTLGGKEKEKRELYKSLDYDKVVGNKQESVPSGGDGDTGAGGTMLGGTGIAEVILPTSIRLKNAIDTAEATKEKERRFEDRDREHEERKRGKKGPSKGVASGSYSHKFRQNQQEWIKNKKAENLQDAEKRRKAEGENNDKRESRADADRPGYQNREEKFSGKRNNNARGSNSAGDGFNQGRSQDDKKFGQFIRKAFTEGRM